MNRSKQHTRGSVKSRAHTTPRLGARELRALLHRLRTTDPGLRLPKLGLAKEPPNWFDALDAAESEEPHPVHERARAYIQHSQSLERRWRSVLELSKAFQDALPQELIAHWLELERVIVARQTLHCVIHYNLGVEDGRMMQVVRDGLDAAGVDTQAIESRRLLLLTTLLRDLAQRLPMRPERHPVG